MCPLTGASPLCNLISVFWLTYLDKTKTSFQAVQKEPKKNQTQKSIFMQTQEINSLQFLLLVGWKEIEEIAFLYKKHPNLKILVL